MAQPEQIVQVPAAPPALSPPDDDDENVELFSAVLSALDRDQLPRLASAILQRLQSGHATSDRTTTVGQPLYGSYHVLFPVAFDGGPRWLVKIPINGTAEKWDELSASALACEANTMRLLKRETSIPLPEVLDFSSTTENILRCPYIMMTFIDGLSLYDVWFGHQLAGTSIDTTLSRRTRALDGIASAMAQLGQFSFRAGGQLIFDGDGQPSDIGPIRQLDPKAMLDRWFIHKDPTDDPIYIEYPANSDPKAYYTFMLDKHPEQKPIPKGLAMLLRQLISWIPEPNDIDPFVLAHPDFDIQNFLVSDEGELQGIVDWDGVAAVPRTLGNEKYPGWLTRDWDPAMYGYTESMDKGEEPEGVWEDSPERLTYYRRVYEGLMAKHCTERKGSKPDTTLCRMSVITENLFIAANDPACRNDILRKLVAEIWDVAGQGEPPDITEIAEMLVEDNVKDGVMNTLCQGFKTLLSKEGL
ncbi:hypothetical protein BJX61DRAFT_544920 [Aspergillus egyptiacus]|nr:hypothetical protein BJX61DRAFT_544920 [Aspergillus egyptiacus]